MYWEQGRYPWKSQIKRLPQELLCHLILYVLKEKKKERRPQQMVEKVLSF